MNLEGIEGLLNRIEDLSYSLIIVLFDQKGSASFRFVLVSQKLLDSLQLDLFLFLGISFFPVKIHGRTERWTSKILLWAVSNFNSDFDSGSWLLFAINIGKVPSRYWFVCNFLVVSPKCSELLGADASLWPCNSVGISALLVSVYHESVETCAGFVGGSIE